MPYRFDSVRSAPGSIADLMLRQGDIQASQAQTLGGIRATTARNIGGAVAGSLQDIAAYKAAAPQREMQQIQLANAREGQADHATAHTQQTQAQHDEMAAQIGHEILLNGGTPDAVHGAMQRAVKGGALTPDEAQQFTLMSVENADKIPDAAKALMSRSANGQALLERMNAPKVRKLGERDPTKDIYDEQTGEIVTRGTPKAERPEKEANPTEASLAMAAARGDKAAAEALRIIRSQHPQAPPAEKAGVWILRNGQTLRVQEHDIRPGDMPMNTREQGRPVTSGDASDLADFDTSKDELAAVRAAISSNDSTGIIARVGATIPFVTQITGWGADAKKRQAVIDRVKQVIGKTLEGGVLRKEDEAKYEKILPNIGDEPSVAASKLEGLDKAIAQRKQRRLDALTDSGYDVTKFNARKAADGDDVKARARSVLAGAGKVSDDGAVAQFLKQNPGFK